MVKHRFIFQFVIGSMLAWTLAARGFDCPNVTPSSSRMPVYAPLRDPTRCEGFFERTVSQPFVELVSLTRGPGLQGDAVAAPLELQAQARVPLQLLVHPMRSVPYYRVDAELPASGTLRWDPAPMLAATRLPPADIGFLAQVPRRAVGLPLAVLPVALTPAARDSRSAVATVRASVDISKVEWRSHRIGGAGGPTSSWTEIPRSQRYAFQRVELAFELPADELAIGIDVQATDARDGRALPMLRLTVVGRRDASVAN